MAKPLLLFFIAFSLLMTSFASAQLTVSQPNAAYNLGDSMKLKLSILEDADIEGLVSVSLICDSYSLPFFVNSITLSANEVKNIDVDALKLSKTGKCAISVELKKYDSIVDSFKSDSFEISNELNVTCKNDKEHLMPGDTLIISGSAKKMDSSPFVGIGSVTFDGKEYDANVKGSFQTSIALDKDIQSGAHTVKVLLNDSYGNSGIAECSVSVNDVPTLINIALNNDSYIPGNELVAEIALYNQANDPINESITATIYNPWGIDVKSESIQDTLSYTFSKTAEPGNWWIYAYSKGIKERKFFYVEEYEIADFALTNGTLTVINQGNVAYQKSLQVVFESANESKIQPLDVDVPVNGDQVFKLKAPSGDYNITIKSDDQEQSFYTSLTGKAISIQSTGFASKIRYIIVSAFVLFSIGLAILARYKIKSRGIKVKLRNIA